MRLQQLRYVVKIAECGSITEAARRLYVSQPSLSAAVRELESEMGIEIFLRTAKGISLTQDGTEFISYARQILDQTELLEERYRGRKSAKRLCSISTQHYSFAVDAFVHLLSGISADEYEFTLRETRTQEIIESVADFRSEIGILYFSSFNEKVLKKLLSEKSLRFTPLFDAEPHVFLSSVHPLAQRESVTLEDLENYPFLAFEQGSSNSFYFAEEILSTEPRKKTITVTDRATLFNLLIGLNGYTFCTGVLNSSLNGDNIVSVPLITDEYMRIGYICSEKSVLSSLAKEYLRELKRLIAAEGYTLLEQ